MLSNYPDIHQQATPRMPPSSNHSYFTEHAIPAGYMEPELGRTHRHQHFGDHLRHQDLHPFPRDPQPRISPPPQARALHDLIQRDIELERMREEIIMSEIVRLREVMMMERELASRRGGNNGFHHIANGVGPTDEGRTLEERIVLSLMERERLKARR